VLVGVSRSTARDQSRRDLAADNELVERIKRLAREHPRFGYRRIRALLVAESRQAINHKRVYRLWKQEQLLVPRKRKKKRRGTSTTERPMGAGRPNAVWSVDFLEDTAVPVGLGRAGAEPDLAAVVERGATAQQLGVSGAACLRGPLVHGTGGKGKGGGYQA